MSDKLTPLERAVVALSRKDPVSSLRTGAGKRGWILGLPSGPPPLANPRLEALRRYAIMRRVHRAGQSGVECEPLREAGFSCKQIEEVDDLVDPGRRRGSNIYKSEEEALIFDGSCFPPIRWN